ncbi:type I polyketide synthase [Streptomyces sp. ME19-01-6]|uniref:type I polyketide synthase n=1 Tax=Streptomyces sp. ME19-01-6 TaxID=3028686 RepID=UPI0029A9BEFD|nr:acyltransferase domain-containing protein [Streptomyces sp. ME19-01-6]MDX3224890.1 acyltransferase domain-containing protein [Streptomyces sp. ME19-01-6]
MSAPQFDGASGEPIAVVGYSARLPQVADPVQVRRLLGDGDGTAGERKAGARATVPIPPTPFDNEFFGISSREAAALDPRQRLALELGWEALEDAGVVPARIAAAETGVFVTAAVREGGAAGDVMAGRQPPGTVADPRTVAGRISWFLGATGPSLTFADAGACSLVAVHAAGESLRRAEVTLALAGGVYAGPDGSPAYGNVADTAVGSVPGEGGCLCVLKTLSRALRDGDRIHALILGSTTHTVPDNSPTTGPDPVGPGEVLRRTHRRARVEPGRVSSCRLVCAGALADDARVAVREAYRAVGHPGTPLADDDGSADAAIGHLGGATGALGLLRAVLATERRRSWSGPATGGPGARPWPPTDEPPVMGVFSYGTGGTYCYVLLGEAPTAAPDAPAAGGTDRAVPWVVSGRTPAALRAQARRLLAHVTERPGLSPADVGYTLATARSEFAHRAVVVGADREGLLRGLADLADRRRSPGLFLGTAAPERRPVLVFPGQGPQWSGMARELLASSAVFRETMDTCAEAFSPFLDWSLPALLEEEPGTPSWERPDVVQPALFSVMIGLAELWRSYGVTPAAVVGHSLGEIAAGCVAGGLSLEDGARVVALWSRAQATLSGRGEMVSVLLSERELRARLRRWGRALAVAAVNGPHSTVVSGATKAVRELEDELFAAGVRTRRIPVGLAMHCAQTEELLEDLRRALAPIRPRPSDIPFYSTVTGDRLDTGELGAGYWCRNMRRTVQLERAVRATLRDGLRLFIELSPHPVLTLGLEETVEDSEPGVAEDAAVTGTLRRGHGGMDEFLTSLAQAYVRGARVDWTPAFDTAGVRRVDLPTYAFQRRGPGAGQVGAEDPGYGTSDRPSLSPPSPEVRHDPLDLVRAHAAVVLGLRGARKVDPEQALTDLGIDSAAAVELRNRLIAATGLRLPATVVLDHPTPSALATYLRMRLAEERTTGADAPADHGAAAGPGSSAQDGEAPMTIESMFLRACGSGLAHEGLELVKAASRLRPVFTVDDGTQHPPRVSRLAHGDTAPMLFCLPTFAGPPDPRHYAGFAAAFQGLRDVWHVPVPGFVRGERLPATVDAVISLLCASVGSCVDDTPFALVGQCAGGWFAHAVASRLEKAGVFPAGVVLMDCYLPEESAAVLAAAMDNGLFERVQSMVRVDGAMVTAIGGYLRTFADWAPTPVAAPTLFLRARDPFPDKDGKPLEGFTARPYWTLPHTAADVPGNHLNMLADHAGTTADHVHRWLLDTVARTAPET